MKAPLPLLVVALVLIVVIAATLIIAISKHPGATEPTPTEAIGTKLGVLKGGGYGVYRFRDGNVTCYAHGGGGLFCFRDRERAAPKDP